MTAGLDVFLAQCGGRTTDHGARDVGCSRVKYEPHVRDKSMMHVQFGH